MARICMAAVIAATVIATVAAQCIPGNVLLEETFDDVALGVTTTDIGPDNQVWSTSMPSGWTKEVTITGLSDPSDEGRPEFKGWTVWRYHQLVSVSGAFTTAFQEGHSNIAVVSPSGYAQGNSAISRSYNMDAKMTSPEITFDQCSEIRVGFAAASSSYQSATVEAFWSSTDGTALGSEVMYTSTSQLENYFNYDLTVPAGASKVVLVFRSYVSNHYSNTYFGVDNIVVRQGPFTDPAHCSEASESKGVWKGGHGSWNSGSSWCGGKVPASVSDIVLKCDQQQLCVVHLDNSFDIQVGQLDASDSSVVLQVDGVLRVGEHGTVANMDIMGQLRCAAGLTITDSLGLYWGDIYGHLFVQGVMMQERGGVTFHDNTLLDIDPSTPTNYTLNYGSPSWDSDTSVKTIIHENARLSLISKSASRLTVNSDMIVKGGSLYVNAPSVTLRGLQLTPGSEFVTEDVNDIIFNDFLICDEAVMTAMRSPYWYVSVNDGIMNSQCEIRSPMGNHLTMRNNGRLNIFNSVFQVTNFTASGGVVVLNQDTDLSTLQNIRVTSSAYVHVESMDQLSVNAVELESSGHIFFHGPTSIEGLYAGNPDVSSSCNVQFHENSTVKYLQWTWGTISGVDPSVYLTVEDEMKVYLDNTKTLYEISMVIPENKVTVWQRGTFSLTYGALFIIPESATFEMVMAGRNIDSSGSTAVVARGTFINHGIWRFKHQYKLSSINVMPRVHNKGEIQLLGATVRFGGIFSNEKDITVAKDATLEFYDGSHTGCTGSCVGYKEMKFTSRILGEGKIVVNNGYPIRVASKAVSPDLEWDIKSGGVILDTSFPIHFGGVLSIANGEFRVGVGSQVSFDHLHVQNGIVEIMGAWTAKRLEQTGGKIYIFQPSDVDIFEWTGGQLYGVGSDGVLNIKSGLWCGTSSIQMYDLKMYVEQSVVWQGTAIVYTYFSSQVIIKEGAALSIRSPRLTWSSTSDSQQYGLINKGVIHVGGFETNDGQISINANLWSSGRVIVERGIFFSPLLEISGSLEIGGSVTVKAPTFLALRPTAVVTRVEGLSIGSIECSNGRVDASNMRVNRFKITGEVVFSTAIKYMEVNSMSISYYAIARIHTLPSRAVIRNMELIGGTFSSRVSNFFVQTLSLLEYRSVVDVRGLTVEGDIVWNGGTIQGFGDVNVGGKVVVQGNQNYLRKVRLSSQGGIETLLASPTMNLYNGAEFASYGTADFSSGDWSLSGDGLFSNYGVLKVGSLNDNTLDTTKFVSFACNFNNQRSGVINIDSGALRMQSYFFSHEGTLTTQADTRFEMYHGFLSQESIINGTGTVDIVSSADVVIMSSVFTAGLFEISSSAKAQLEFIDSQVDIQYMSVQSSSKVTVLGNELHFQEVTMSGGEIKFEVSNLILEALTLDGNGYFELNGNGKIVQRFDWLYGRLNGESGVLRVEAPEINLNKTGTTAYYTLNRHMIVDSDILLNTESYLAVSGQAQLEITEKGSLYLGGDKAQITGNGIVKVFGKVFVEDNPCPAEVRMSHMQLAGEATMDLVCSNVIITTFTSVNTASISLGSTAKMTLSNSVVLEGNITGRGEISVSSGRVVLSRSGKQDIGKLTTTGSTAQIQIEDTRSVIRLESIVATGGSILLNSDEPDSVLPVGDITIGNAEVYLQSKARVENLEMTSRYSNLRLDTEMVLQNFDFKYGTIASSGTVDGSIMIEGQFTVNGPSDKNFDDVTIVNQDAMTIVGDSGSIYLRGRAILKNEGTIDISTQWYFYQSYGGLVVNDGIINVQDTTAGNTQCHTVLRCLPGSVMNMGQQWQQHDPMVLMAGAVINADSAFGFYDMANIDHGAAINGERVNFYSAQSERPHGPRSGTWNVANVYFNGYTTWYGSNQHMVTVFDIAKFTNTPRVVLAEGTVNFLPGSGKARPVIAFDKGSSSTKYPIFYEDATVDYDMELTSSTEYYVTFGLTKFNGKYRFTEGYLRAYGAGGYEFNDVTTIVGTGAKTLTGANAYYTFNSVVNFESGPDITFDTYAVVKINPSSTWNLFQNADINGGSGRMLNYGTLMMKDGQVDIRVDYHEMGTINLKDAELRLLDGLYLNPTSVVSTGDSLVLVQTSWQYFHPGADLSSLQMSLNIGGGAEFHLRSGSKSPSYLDVQFNSYNLKVYIESETPEVPMCLNTLTMGTSRMYFYIQTDVVVDEFKTSYNPYLYFEDNVSLTTRVVHDTGYNVYKGNDAQFARNVTGPCTQNFECSACLSTSGCGWDTVSSKCFAGDATGPAEGKRCGWTMDSSQCPAPCASLGNEDDCEVASDTCVWCPGQTCETRTEGMCSGSGDLIWVGPLSGGYIEREENWMPSRVPLETDTLYFPPTHKVRTVRTEYSSSTVFTVKSILIPHHGADGHTSIQLYRPLEVTGTSQFSESSTLWFAHSYGRFISLVDVEFQGSVRGDGNQMDFRGAGMDGSSAVTATITFHKVPRPYIYLNGINGVLTEDLTWTYSYTHYLQNGAQLTIPAGTKQHFYSTSPWRCSTTSYQGKMVVEGEVGFSLPSSTSVLEMELDVVFQNPVTINNGIVIFKRTAEFQQPIIVKTDGRLQIESAGPYVFGAASGIQSEGHVYFHNRAEVDLSGIDFRTRLFTVGSYSKVTIPRDSLDSKIDTLTVKEQGLLTVPGSTTKLEIVDLRLYDGDVVFTCDVDITGSVFVNGDGNFYGTGDVDFHTDDVKIYDGRWGGDPDRTLTFHGRVQFQTDPYTQFRQSKFVFLNDLVLGRQYFQFSGGVRIETHGNTRMINSFDVSACSGDCALASWSNFGNITVEVSDGHVSDILIPFYNEGNVHIKQGHLRLADGTSKNNAFVLEDNTELRLYPRSTSDRPPFHFESTSGVIGNGRLEAGQEVQFDGLLEVYELDLRRYSNFKLTDMSPVATINRLRYWDTSSSSAAQFDVTRPRVDVADLYCNGYASTLINTNDFTVGSFEFAYRSNCKYVVNGISSVEGTFTMGGGTMQVEENSVLSIKGYSRIWDTTYWRGLGKFVFSNEVAFRDTMRVYENTVIDVAPTAVWTHAGSLTYESTSKFGTFNLMGKMIVQGSRQLYIRNNIAASAEIIITYDSILYARFDVDVQGKIRGEGTYYLYDQYDLTFGDNAEVSVWRFENHFNTDSNNLPYTMNSLNFTAGFMPKEYRCSGNTGYWSTRYGVREIYFDPSVTEYGWLYASSDRCNLNFPGSQMSVKRLELTSSGRVFLHDDTKMHIEDFRLGGTLSGGSAMVTVDSMSLTSSSAIIQNPDVTVAMMHTTLSNFYLRGSTVFTIDGVATFTGTSSNSISVRDQAELIIPETTEIDWFLAGSINVESLASYTGKVLIYGKIRYYNPQPNTFYWYAPVEFHGEVTLEGRTTLVMYQVAAAEGTFTLDDECTLKTASRSSQFDSPVQIDGGAFMVATSSASSTTIYAESLNVNNIVISSGTLSMSRYTSGSMRTFAKEVRLDGGEWNVLNSIDIPTLYSRSTITVGPGAILLVATRFEFQSGTLQGRADSIIQVDGNLLVTTSSTKYIDQLTLVMQGQASWRQSSTSMRNNAIIRVAQGSTMLLEASSSMSGTGQLIVDGEFNIEACSDNAALSIPMNVGATGECNLQGSLTLNQGGSLAEGSYVKLGEGDGQSADLIVRGQVLTVVDATVLVGTGRLVADSSGRVVFNSGELPLQLVVKSSGRIEVTERSHNVTLLQGLDMQSGTAQGDGVFTVGGNFFWSGGNIDAAVNIVGAGGIRSTTSKTVSRNGVLSVAKDATLVHEQGTLSLSQGLLTVREGGIFAVQPLGQLSISTSSGGKVVNAGIFAVVDTIEPFPLGSILNSGRIVVLNAEVNFQGAADLTATSRIQGDGTITATSTVYLGGEIRMTGMGEFICQSCSMQLRSAAIIAGRFTSKSGTIYQNKDFCQNQDFLNLGLTAPSCSAPFLSIRGVTSWICDYSRYSSCGIENNIDVLNSGTMTIESGTMSIGATLRNSGVIKVKEGEIREWSYNRYGQLYNLERGSVVFEDEVSTSVNIDILNEGLIIVNENRTLTSRCVIKHTGTMIVDGDMNINCNRGDIWYHGVVAGTGKLRIPRLNCGTACGMYPSTGGFELDGDLYVTNGTFVTKVRFDGIINPLDVTGTVYLEKAQMNILQVSNPDTVLSAQLTAVRSEETVVGGIAFVIVDSGEDDNQVAPNWVASTTQSSIGVQYGQVMVL